MKNKLFKGLIVVACVVTIIASLSSAVDKVKSWGNEKEETTTAIEYVYEA